MEHQRQMLERCATGAVGFNAQGAFSPPGSSRRPTRWLASAPLRRWVPPKH